MRSKTVGALLALTILAASIGALASFGGAAAYPANQNTTFANTTFTTSDQTDVRSVYAEVSNTSNATNVYIYAEQNASNASEYTEVKNVTGIDVGADTTRLVEQDVNESKYEQYRVLVYSEADNATADVEVGTIEEVAATGGGLAGIDTSDPSVRGGIAVLAVVGLIVYVGRRS